MGAEFKEHILQTHDSKKIRRFNGALNPLTSPLGMPVIKGEGFQRFAIQIITLTRHMASVFYSLGGQHLAYYDVC